MWYWKLSLILSLVWSQGALARGFSSGECLKASFETSIKHEGKFFGLIKNDLSIKKNECLLNVRFKNILETEWMIDICREPIHMKVTSKGSQNVYKRKGDCGDRKSDYCSYWNDLKETVQDYGLIFAKGDREDLNSDHGQTYCTYLLVKKYLSQGVLFSKYQPTPNLFTAPKKTEEVVSPQPAEQPIVEDAYEENKDQPESMEFRADDLLDQEEPPASDEAGVQF